MKLIEALQVIRSGREHAATQRFSLATGFQPLHLGTFLAAHLQRNVREARVELENGLFGDLVGNVRRAATADVVGLAVVIEWADLDRRLGLRENGGWAPAVLDDVVATVRSTLGRLAAEVTAASERMPVAICLPTLALPPIAYTSGLQASAFELQVRAEVLQFAARLAERPRVRVVSQAQLDAMSPAAVRHSVRSELATGFPYDQAHADAIATSLANLLLPPAPKKGLITDLDDTVWLGILGEVGVAGVSWDLEHHAQLHGLYQQLVTSLADAGVLVAVASKNDETLVEEAFRRDDLVLPRDRVFPLLASWGAKSKAIDAVLDAWNVGADSLVFVDDSPIELAEVKARHPEVECRLFPKNDPDALMALLRELRGLFGRPLLQAEDALRRESLKGAAEMRASASASEGDEESFIAGMDATVSLLVGTDAADARAFELINKTNQFNVNGERYLEADWTALKLDPNAVVLTISYTDKFGPLGKIAVLAGVVDGSRVRVDRWVMSCRAFARRIEHATLRAVFDIYGVEEVVVDYVPTARNGPSRDFLAALVDLPAESGLVTITREQFERVAPTLYHRVVRSALAHTAND